MTPGHLTITDRLLLGERVAVIGPNLTTSRQVVTDTAQELKHLGHHAHHSISKVSLDNGGTLEATTPTGIRGRTLDHVVILGAVDDHDVLPAVIPGGTISRR